MCKGIRNSDCVAKCDPILSAMNDYDPSEDTECPDCEEQHDEHPVEAYDGFEGCDDCCCNECLDTDQAKMDRYLDDDGE